MKKTIKLIIVLLLAIVAIVTVAMYVSYKLSETDHHLLASKIKLTKFNSQS